MRTHLLAFTLALAAACGPARVEPPAVSRAAPSAAPSSTAPTRAPVESASVAEPAISAPVAEPAISAPVEAASTSGPAPAPSDATDEPPPELMAEFKRLEPGMADCIQAEWGSGEWTTQTVDVDWTLDRDGRLTAHFVKASTWCSAAVVERRLDALRFAPRDRALHGTHRFVFRMRI